MDYITVAQVDDLLGAGWAGAGDPARAVLMANTWLSAKSLPAFEAVPDAVIQAGAEVAREAAAGKLYAEQGREVLETEVEAKGVSSRKVYAEGSRAISAGESFALALIRPYLRGSVMMLKRI